MTGRHDGFCADGPIAGIVLVTILAASIPGCYASHPGAADGERDALDDAGRLDADADAEGDAPAETDAESRGVIFMPDTASPEPGTLSLSARAVDPRSITIAVEVTAKAETPNVFGVAARLRYRSDILRFRAVRSCGAFDLAGSATLAGLEVPRDARDADAETWLAIATANPESLVAARATVCAILVDLEVVGSGSTRLDLDPGRSAAIGAHPAEFATSRVAGGRLEVTR